MTAPTTVPPASATAMRMPGWRVNGLEGGEGGGFVRSLVGRVHLPQQSN